MKKSRDLQTKQTHFSKKGKKKKRMVILSTNTNITNIYGMQKPRIIKK